MVFFVVFSTAVLVAFWPSYFSRLGSQSSYHPHAHGIAMTLWCLMLVTQAALIKINGRRLHRQLGWASLVLVPCIVAATLNFVHFRVAGVTAISDGLLYFLALIVNALVAFVVLYGLAIHHRRNRGVHARYMLSTIFPLFTPVTDRLIGANFTSLAAYAPTIGGAAVVPVFGFALADLIVLGLLVWDWRINRRLDVFPIVLAILLAYHASVLTLHVVPAWSDFAAWFVRLPLS
jgi:hypothetical protein